MDDKPPDENFLSLFLHIDSLLIIIGLFLCSALLSGSEVAFFFLSKKQLATLKQSENRIDKLLFKLRENHKDLLATILIANNFVNISIVLIFAHFIENIYFFRGYTEQSTSIVFLVEVGIITIFILFFGEIIPKIYASKNKLFFSRVMAYPIYLLQFSFVIIYYPFKKFSNFLQKFLKKKKSKISVDHLSDALEVTLSKATSKEEKKILKGIVTFGKKKTKQIMRSRVDIIAIEEGTPYNDVMTTITTHRFSRMPIYKETIDNIVGVLYAKDLLLHTDKKDYNWKHLIRDAFFISETKKLNDLLKEFQKSKTHLAIALDEYGGTSGLVTLEDVIEEIVGEIDDEFDYKTKEVKEISTKTSQFEGKILLNDFYKYLKIGDKESRFEENKGGAESLGGFLLEIKSTLPKEGEIIWFNDIKFTIVEVDSKTIKRINVEIFS